MVALMRRGEIWVARLNPNQGAEVDKLRPVVIVQADPITQQLPDTRALRVPIRSRDRLLCDSYAMADQPRSPHGLLHPILTRPQAAANHPGAGRFGAAGQTPCRHCRGRCGARHRAR
jgi:mRNA interferase MazF